MAGETSVFDVWSRLRLDDTQYKSELATAKSATAAFGTTLLGSEKRVHAFGGAMKGIAKMALGAAGFAGVVGVLKAGVEKFAEFEGGILKIQTALGSGRDAFAMYGTGLSDMSKRLVLPTAALSEGLYQTLAANVDATKAMGVMGDAGKLAVGGFSDVGAAVNALTGVINSYGYSLDKTTHVANVFAAVQASTGETLDSLAGGVLRIAPLAAKVGVEFEDVASALGVATDHGLDMARATDALQQSISAIITPSPRAKKWLAAYGLDLSEGLLREKGIIGALKYLHDGLKGNDALFRRVIGSTDAFNLAMTLTSEQGMGEFAAMTKTARENVTALDDNFATRSKSISFKIEKMKLAWGDLVKTIGQGFVEGIGLRQGFGDLDKQITEMGLKIGKWMGEFVKNLRTNLEIAAELLRAYLAVKGAQYVGVLISKLNQAGVAAAGVGLASAGGGVAAAGGGRVYDPMTNRTTGGASAARGGGLGLGAARAVQAVFIAGAAWEVGQVIGTAIGAFIAGRQGDELGLGATEGRNAIRKALRSENPEEAYAAMEINALRARQVEKLRGEWAGSTEYLSAGYKEGSAVPSDAAFNAWVDEKMAKFDTDSINMLQRRFEKLSDAMPKAAARSAGIEELVNDIEAMATGQRTGEETAAMLKPVPVRVDFGLRLDVNDKNKDRSYSLADMVSRGEGDARAINPRYRMFMRRRGVGGTIVAPLAENVFTDQSLLNGAS